MSNSTFKTTSNELIQDGTYVRADLDTSSGKTYNGLRVVYDSLFDCKYYLQAEKTVDADVSCKVELLTLAGTSGTLTIKAGKRTSDNYLSSLFLKASRIVSSPTPSETSTQKFIIGSSPKNGRLDSALANNILSDYKDGVFDSEMTIDCADYDSNNKNKYINWFENGETVEPDSIVLKEENNTYYRVTGRTFTKQGVPMEKLEVKRIYKE